MVRLDAVQRLMENAAKTNILFLDACRNNPLSRNLARAMGTRSAAIGHGLAAAESRVGTLISYSTQPGNVALDGNGRNSPYAGPLAKTIATPGEDVLSILIGVRNEVLAATGDQQVPWENHALRAPFYFNPAKPLKASPPALAPTRPSTMSARPQIEDPQSTKYPIPIGAETQAFISCLAVRSQRLYEGAHYRVVTVSPVIRYLSPLVDELTFSIAYENCRISLKQN
jgi:hypothetical protein